MFAPIYRPIHDYMKPPTHVRRAPFQLGAGLPAGGPDRLGGRAEAPPLQALRSGRVHLAAAKGLSAATGGSVAAPWSGDSADMWLAHSVIYVGMIQF